MEQKEARLRVKLRRAKAEEEGLARPIPSGGAAKLVGGLDRLFSICGGWPGTSSRHPPQIEKAASFGGPPTSFAEEEGFEPPVPLGTPVFKTGAFNRSATPPFLSECKGNRLLAEMKTLRAKK